jgi:hypothetical protein
MVQQKAPFHHPFGFICNQRLESKDTEPPVASFDALCRMTGGLCFARQLPLCVKYPGTPY